MEARPLWPSSPPPADPLRRLWRLLVAPAPGVTGADDRQRARFLSALLLFAFPLSLAAGALHLLTRAAPLGGGDLVWIAGPPTMVAAAWVLSRTRHFRLAAALTIAASLLGPWLMATREVDPIRVLALTTFPLAGVFLCAVYFRIRTTAAISGLHLAGAATLAFAHPAVSPEQAAPFLGTTLSLVVVVLVVSGLIRRILAALERKTAELEASEERYSLATQGSRDGLWDWNPITGDAWFSSEWFELIGRADDERGQRTLGTWLERVADEDEARVREALARHLAGRSERFEVTHRVRGEADEPRWLMARGRALRDARGTPVRMTGLLSDVTEQKEAEERLRHDAFHDPLTGLANRALFEDRLRQILARTERQDSADWAVLYVDLDRFKWVNDTLGHDAGDALLLEVSARLQSCVRPADTVARLGGDEFAVLLDRLGRFGDAELIAERIQDALQEPVPYGEAELVTSASIGIAPGARGYGDPHEVMHDADAAMYRVKAGGRAGHHLFEAGRAGFPSERPHPEQALRRALDTGELRVHYQPVIDLETTRIDGFEALVRWEDPERGLLGPDAFLRIAETSGLIHRLGRWVLATACRDLAAWRDQLGGRRLALFVNLSGHQLRDTELPAWVLRVLRETGMEPSDLRLDVSESVASSSAPVLRVVTDTLRREGVKVCIDDFGTGHTAVIRLRDMPCDALKIDRSLVATLGGEARDEGLVRTLVAVGRSLGLSVVAEGVETPEQLARLGELGCDHAQGHLFSPPVEAPAAGALAARNPAW